MGRNTATGTATLTVALCFLAALIEGLDIVAPGLVAPQIADAFGLGPAQVGWLFSASTVGLLLGALQGGWLADRVGRKRVLIGSMVTFGAMSILTALATTTSILFLGRFLVGVGLGGALPNLIALSAEAGPKEGRTTRVTLMYSGVPLGGALGGAIALWGGASENWRILFFVGGGAPIVLAVALALLLSESPLFAQLSSSARTSGSRTLPALFGPGTAAVTLFMWVSFCGTLLILYLFTNWLPLLFVNAGFSRREASIATMVFNIGGAVGAAGLGRWMDRGHGPRVMLTCFSAMGAAIVALFLSFRIEGVGLVVASAAAFAVGVFVIGTQLVLYGVAPGYYQTRVRATGVGAAVAAGRVGSIVGPLLAGSMLGAGANAAGVVTAMLPVVAVAGLAAVALLRRPALAEP